MFKLEPLESLDDDTSWAYVARCWRKVSTNTFAIGIISLARFQFLKKEFICPIKEHMRRRSRATTFEGEPSYALQCRITGQLAELG